MAGGIVGLGQSYRQRAQQGLAMAAQDEQRIDQANEQTATAKKSATLGGAATGATLGFKVSGGNPIGAVAGGVIGAVLPNLF